ncbi:DUF4357 domain-containing protein [Faunimonas sp. B44]|uniref:DUF4357 domain-containing protein n=1 Tax=Faunimonas sp. B44 TaxID=3461493 RepID=UPI004044F69D
MGDWFVMQKQSAQATGRETEDGKFLVRVGSTAMKHGSPIQKRDKEDQKSLVDAGVLIPWDDATYVFTCDHEFSSVSKATGVIIDGNASGPKHWKHVKTKETLQDRRRIRKP